MVLVSFQLEVKAVKEKDSVEGEQEKMRGNFGS